MPALQLIGASEPVEQKAPASHGVHCLLLTSPGVLLYEPSKHGSAADEPSAQNEPAKQEKHAVAPLAFMKEPPSHLSQTPCLSAGCTVPGLHGVWTSEPVEQDDPAGQSSHSLLLPSPGMLLYVPSSHGSGAAAPSAQKEPGTQLKHSVCPDTFMNVPGMHLSHEPCSVSFCTVPGAHSVGADAPVLQKEPAGHAMQSSALVITASDAFWYRPNGHGSPADAPCVQYSPGSQSGHAVSPSSDWYVPASHLSQEPFAASGCTVPGAQAVGVAAPVLQNDPAGHSMQSSGAVITTSDAFWYRPDGHGRPAADASVQYSPGLHAWHSVCPDTFMNVPGMHFSHKPCPADGCTVPGAHGVGVRAPVEHSEPAGHAVHCSRAARPVALLYVPSGHGSGADAPSAQKEPATQS